MYKSKLRVLTIFMFCLFFLGLTSVVKAEELRIFSGAGLMKPMEELRQNFEKKNNVTISVHYGSSGEIFGMMSMGQTCDVFIPGAEKYTNDAVKNGWLYKPSIIKIVKHIPVIVVPAGNPLNIKSLDDLARPGLKVALCDPKSAAIGKVSKKLLGKCKLWKKVEPNVVVFAPTCNQLLIYTALDQADATINWLDVTTWAEGRGKVQTIKIDPARNMIKTIPTALHISAKDNPLAVKLNDYIASSEGMAVWEKWGFEACTR
ncbi:molybdate ABC transporter substrate-binding protein [Maridesulfovibrio ferrireducens]|uniref:molybdate ABC transporter substrate-binding protein n=1 Tax=Maridesulfovibrio ferrireducens TaxID=246191 RepID=UPI0026F37431|nr:molybdate ABC transporter substrate-binding protein [Maridesulfovibrio ferrireducens]